MQIEIKKLGTSDHSALWKIVKDCKDELKLNAELDWNENSLRDAAKVSQIIGLIINGENFSEIIGFVLYRGVASDAELDLVALSPKYHRMGLMSKLFNILSKQFKELWLEVHVNNIRAIKFYEKNGFHFVRIRERYYKDGASCIVMRRSAIEENDNSLL